LKTKDININTYLNKATRLISVIFIVLWVSIIFSEFWHYDPGYSKSLKLFQYYDLLGIIFGIGFGFIWLLKKNKNKSFKYINGLNVFFGLLLLNCISISFFYGKISNIDLHFFGLLSHLWQFIVVAFYVFLVYLVIRLLGVLFTSSLPLRVEEKDLPIIQIAIGLLILTSILFFLGTIGMLYGFVLIPISVTVLALYWRQTIQVIRNTCLTTIKIPKELNAIGVFSFLILSLFLVLNFVLIIRPFPMGSDALNLYVNLPSLLSKNHSLVQGNQPYNWSLFMSVGSVVFDRIDVVLALSYLGGLLSLFALFRISRKWLDVNYSAFVLLLFYSTPMINFLSYLDMKIDMGLLFITLTTLLLYYNWAVPINNAKKTTLVKGIGLVKANAFFTKRIPDILKQNHLLVIIGLLVGYGFGVKMTVLFFFFALHCSIWYLKGGKLTFLASFVLCFATVFLLKLDVQPGLRQFHKYVPLLQWSLFFSGLGMIVYLFFKRRDELSKLITYSTILGCFFALPILPWLGKNYSETNQLTVHSLLNGKKDAPVFEVPESIDTPEIEEVEVSGIYQMPDASNIKEKRRNKNLNKSISEDIHRFMGYEIMPVRYLSLPYDVFIKTNISKYYTDVGFILLLLFPVLFLFPNRKERSSILTRLSFIVLCLLLLLIAIPGAFMNQYELTHPMEGISLLDSSVSSGFLESVSHVTTRILLEIYTPIHEYIESIYTRKDPVTYSTLIFLFLIILTLIYNRVKSHTKVTQSMILFLLMYFFLWWILGAGIAWYGMLIFTIPYIFLLKTIEPQKEIENNLEWTSNISRHGKKIVFLSAGSIWIFFAFTQRATNYTPVNEEVAKHIYYPSILEYQIGNLNEEELTDYHFPSIRLFAKFLNTDDTSLIYRIGSPIYYFIDKNDSRVLNDTFLDLFEKLVKEYENKEQIIDALKEHGINYIVFDLNMAKYDETPGKTLTRKFSQFLNTLHDNPKVELVATNRVIKSEETGEIIFSIFPDEGTIVNEGQIALFFIK
jgi:hypothetical protein